MWLKPPSGPDPLLPHPFLEGAARTHQKDVVGHARACRQTARRMREHEGSGATDTTRRIVFQSPSRLKGTNLRTGRARCPVSPISVIREIARAAYRRHLGATRQSAARDKKGTNPKAGGHKAQLYRAPTQKSRSFFQVITGTILTRTHWTESLASKCALFHGVRPLILFRSSGHRNGASHAVFRTRKPDWLASCWFLVMSAMS